MGSTSSSEGSSESVSPPQPHAVLFPFMAKGHTIPLLHFARLLLRRGIAVTVITTASNIPFMSHSLEGTAASVVPLQFPAGIAGIPSGTESTDELPSMSLFFRFASATSLMQPPFDRLLRSLPRVTFLVSDAFLWWTLHSASKLGIPRLVFSCSSCYSHALRKEVYLSGLFNGPQFDDEYFTLARFPWIRISKFDFEPEIRNPDPHSLAFEFRKNMLSATSKSYGILVNTFYELEPVFADYANTECTPKSWCVGPFCLQAEPKRERKWAEWLDQKLEEQREVLYVAFGREAEAEICGEQVKEIAMGLEESKVNFLWVIRRREWEREIREGFEERVKDRGMVVREREWDEDGDEEWGILKHESVKGFVSSCEWKAVVESVCGGVAMVAWPVVGEQHLNARMVEEEMKVGFRVERRRDGWVRREGLDRRVRELMEGDKGREARKKVKELALMANEAFQEGGSSWWALESLIHETCMQE